MPHLCIVNATTLAVDTARQGQTKHNNYHKPKENKTMKKFFLMIAVALVSLTASAQVYVGGEVGVWRNSDANHTSLTINPEVGYQLSDKWDLGIGIDYSHNYSKGLKVNAFGVDPYARWSFAKFGPVSLFLDMTAGVSTYKTKFRDNDASDANTAWRVGVTPGVKVALAKNIDFVAHCGFLGYRDSDDAYEGGTLSPYGEDGFGFNVNGNSLTFGINYRF